MVKILFCSTLFRESNDAILSKLSLNLVWSSKMKCIRIVNDGIFYYRITNNIVQFLSYHDRLSPEFSYGFVEIQNISSHQFTGNGFPCFFYDKGFPAVFLSLIFWMNVSIIMSVTIGKSFGLSFTLSISKTMNGSSNSVLSALLFRVRSVSSAFIKILQNK